MSAIFSFTETEFNELTGEDSPFSESTNIMEQLGEFAERRYLIVKRRSGRYLRRVARRHRGRRTGNRIHIRGTVNGTIRVRGVKR